MVTELISGVRFTFFTMILLGGLYNVALWGVGMANLFYLPIGDKLKYRHDLEMQRLDLIVEGVTAIQSGDNPRVIRMRLLSFLHPRERES